MKKYATLSIDSSTLATEIMTYLKSSIDVEDNDHHIHAFHVLNLTDLANTTLNTTFTGLTAKFVGHLTINGSQMFNHCYDSAFMLIPLEDCESTVVKIFDVAPGAVFNPTDSCYMDQDCTLANALPLTSPIVISANTTHTIETTNFTKLADVLMIIFNEDVSTLLA
jgi:hypothetical protein